MSILGRRQPFKPHLPALLQSAAPVASALLLKRRRGKVGMILYAPGVTSKSLTIQIVDDSGLAVTGLVAATFPSLSYQVAGPNAAVAFPALSDLAAITTAYSSGGVKELSGGYYRLDVPDAAWASAGKVRIIGEASGKHVLVETIDVSYPQSDFRQVIGTTLTESAGGRVKTAFTTLFDVASPVFTTASVNQTGDSYARLGAPAGASIAADLAEIEAETDGIAAIPTNPYTGTPPTVAQIATAVFQDTTAGDFTVAGSIGKSLAPSTLGTVPGAAGGLLIAGTNALTSFASGSHFIGTVDMLTTYTGNTVQTGDSYARLGAPAGASIAADLAEIEAETDGIAAIPTNPYTGTPPTTAQIATAVWQDSTAGDFTTASSIGFSLYTGNHAPGAASGLAIVGSAMSLVANQHVIVDSGTVTTLTNLPSIQANWLTAAGINAGA